jgi:hypothetical protein
MTPHVTGVAYDASAGTITLSGTGLGTDPSQYDLSDFTVSGEGNGKYTLTSASSVVTPIVGDGSIVTIQLSGQDQIQVAALLDLDGHNALDGTHFNLQLTAGWDGPSSTAAPHLTVQATNAYLLDAATGDYVGSATGVGGLDALIVAADAATSGHFEIELANDIEVGSALAACRTEFSCS